VTTANLPARANGLALPHGAGRVGQGTEIEKSRAASEVYYRVIVAHEVPRVEEAARDAMRTACANPRLAAKAFYSVPKGGERATGPSVHLARELARIWGNIDYGVHELRRDDDYGQSEMQAFAWDLQTNARSASIFIQPHRMDTKRGPKILTEVQAIYESNANAGARRVREAIFAVLPADFVDEAQELCHATLAKGDGSPLEERRTKAIGAFEKTFGVTEQQLVDRIGRAVSRWDAEDVAALQVLYRSLQSREVLVEVEFPKAETTVTAEEIAARSQAARKPAETPGPDPRDEDRTAEYVQAMAEDGAS
jgi:hypothetical protein